MTHVLLSRLSAALFSMALTLPWTAADGDEKTTPGDAGTRVLERYERLRPDADELNMYRLDWVETLEQALVLSKADKRPILLVIIHARYGDIVRGHC